jgi:uncharacterized membrane protein YbjE (DUF340 family)
MLSLILPLIYLTLETITHMYYTFILRFVLLQTCHYVAVVHGRCSRGSTEPWSSTGRKDNGGSADSNSSSSSKLSGGAIAGIVIGSIIGSLILSEARRAHIVLKMIQTNPKWKWKVVQRK